MNPYHDIEGQGAYSMVYLNPQKYVKKGPKPIITALKTIILHTSGAQVVFTVQGSET